MAHPNRLEDRVRLLEMADALPLELVRIPGGMFRMGFPRMNLGAGTVKAPSACGDGAFVSDGPISGDPGAMASSCATAPREAIARSGSSLL